MIEKLTNEAVLRHKRRMCEYFQSQKFPCECEIGLKARKPYTAYITGGKPKNKNYKSCDDYISQNYEESAQIIKNWAKDHPEKENCGFCIKPLPLLFEDEDGDLCIDDSEEICLADGGDEYGICLAFKGDSTGYYNGIYLDHLYCCPVCGRKI